MGYDYLLEEIRKVILARQLKSVEVYEGDSALYTFRLPINAVFRDHKGGVVTWVHMSMCPPDEIKKERQ
jgi:hypothetical protein